MFKNTNKGNGYTIVIEIPRQPDPGDLKTEKALLRKEFVENLE